VEIPDVHRDTLRDILYFHYLDVMEYPSEYAGGPKELAAVLAEGQKLCGLFGMNWQELLVQAQQPRVNPYDREQKEQKT